MDTKPWPETSDTENWFVSFSSVPFFSKTLGLFARGAVCLEIAMMFDISSMPMSMNPTSLEFLRTVGKVGLCARHCSHDRGGLIALRTGRGNLVRKPPT